jgi:hypothetical protein
MQQNLYEADHLDYSERIAIALEKMAMSQEQSRIAERKTLQTMAELLERLTIATETIAINSAKTTKMAERRYGLL